MSPPNKRTPQETWDALEQMALDDEAERVVGLGDAELDQELKDAGVDPAKVRARGRELAEELQRAPMQPQGPQEPGRVVPFRRARWVALIAAAVSLVTLAMWSGPVLVGHPRPDDEGADARHKRGAVLRAKALSECAAAQWQ